MLLTLNLQLMFPFLGIAFLTIPWVLSLKPKTETLRAKLARVDWIGGVCFTTSTILFLMAVSWGGTEESWSSFRTLVPLILGTLGIIAALGWEVYGAKEPFLRHRLFHCTSSYAVFFGAMVQGCLVSMRISFSMICSH
jgi:quinol-cytochrome oxidoreductase complex cytochrome b subunit